MKKIILAILVIFSIITISYADDFKATVESKNVVLGEPFELKLVYSGAEQNVNPDLSVLQKDFQIYSNATSMQTSYINGVINQQHSWTIGLIALQEGKVSIPSISAGKFNSESIDLEVLPAGSSIKQEQNSQESNTQPSAPKFKTDFVIDEKNPYVKQEIIGTLVIKDYIGLEFVSDPMFVKSDDWSIKIVEQPEISAIEGGREIKIHFAMFPLKSGELEIPALQWQAVYFEIDSVPQPRQFGFFGFSDFSLMNKVQKPVMIQTKPQKVKVKAIPDEYAKEWWLPAKALNLSSKFDEKNNSFRVGDTINREVVLSAAGVLDTELPELNFTAPNGMKQYPENPQYSVLVHNNELIAQAKYRIVYIPQQSGKIVLPEISLRWFNTEKGKMETAKISAKEIEIAENPEYSAAIEENMSDEVVQTPKNDMIHEEKTDNAKSKNKENFMQENAYLWLIAAFFLGMIINYLLLRLKKTSDKNEKYIDKIRKNLRDNDYRSLRDNLLKWGNKNFHNFMVNNLNDLAMLIGDEDFSMQMQIINRVLYSDAKETPDSAIILQGLKKGIQHQQKTDKSAPLPKLYE